MYKNFGVHIKCLDLARSVKFYLDLGLEPEFAYGSPEFCAQFGSIPTAAEKYNGVRLKLADAIIELADGHMAVKPEVFKKAVDSSKVSAMIGVESVAEIEKICEENDYKISVPITEYPWGTRELVVKDPDGWVLVFIEAKVENRE